MTPTPGSHPRPAIASVGWRGWLVPAAGLLSIAPWIAFWILDGTLRLPSVLGISLLLAAAAIAVALVAGTTPNMLEGGDAVAWLVLLLASFAFAPFLQHWVLPLVNLALLLLSLASLALGRPFTEGLLVGAVGREVAAGQGFRAFNRTLTAGWAVAFAVMTLLSAAPAAVGASSQSSLWVLCNVALQLAVLVLALVWMNLATRAFLRRRLPR